ncbi:hypothetical protein GGI18_003652, partial [Coemansia linderi]
MSLAKGDEFTTGGADETQASASSSPEVAGDDAHQQFASKYGEFLSSGFDAVSYAQRIGGAEAGDGITQLMATLASRADSLESLLKHTILRSHAELLEQVTGVRAVDSALGQIEEQVREIRACMHGLRSKVRVPYEQARAYTRQAANLQAATACVRATAKFMQLARRLRAQTPDGGGADFALAALTLQDIDRVAGGLRGVRVVDGAMADVAARRARTLAEAERLVGGGMRRAHAGDVAAGLLIQSNAGALPAAVAATVRRCTVEWAAHVAGRLDPRAMQAAAAQSAAGLAAELWGRVEALADGLAARGAEVRLLERVLARRRDASFLDAAVAQLGDRPLAFWWGTAVAALAAELDAACAESSAVRHAVVSGYARLVQLLLPRLEPLLSPRLGGVVSVGGAVAAGGAVPVSARAAPVSALMPHVRCGDPGPAVLWDRLLARYEAEYVKRAAARIADAVGRCFPPPPPPGLLDAQEAWAGLRPGGDAVDLTAGGPPPRSLVAGVVRSIATELEMAKSDTRLGAAVAQAAAAAVASFAAASDARLAGAAAGSASAAGAPLLPGLVNAAEALRAGLAALSDSEYAGRSDPPGSSVTAIVRDVLGGCERDLLALIGRQTALLLDAADKPILQAIAASADVSGDQALFEAPMQWLQTQVLEPLESDCCRPLVLAMVDRYLGLYAHVVCLTFPLTEDARLSLTAEATQFEFACSQLVAASATKTGALPGPKLADVGRSYRALRMVRPLLFTDLDELQSIVEGTHQQQEWKDLPVVDLVDHVVCRVATEAGSDASFLPFSLLGWSKRQWIEELASGSENTEVKQALL